MFLITMGVFAKFAAALVAIPAPVLGGMTTFLFCAVAVSGMAIVSRVPFTRRTRFILTASLAVGYGATLVPTWFDGVFTYRGGNRALAGLCDAVVLVMETGFAVTALLAILLNLSIGEEVEVEVRELEGRRVPHLHEQHSSPELEDVDTEKVVVGKGGEVAASPV